mmetsp:Transcript_4741/g.7964  ORF Transcript_4741/g.7964 Transcript_4741/m.7964 type:complete len:495 (-) Transcript_4741:65-1549(-)
MILYSQRSHHRISHYFFSKSLVTKNMSSFDKSLFSKSLPLVSIRIRKENCTKYQQNFKGYLFDRPRMKKIHDVPGEPDLRFILLNESISSADTLPHHLILFNEEQGGVLGQYELKLGYNDLSVDEVLRRLLPDVSEVPSSFEQVGHVAHMNLREDALPHKNIIGQVILDKNPKLRTVVNKIGQIETEFRTFPMEVLAGDNDFEVSVKESGATFKFNFKDVYWNSRLGTEHNRVIMSILQAHSTKKAASVATTKSSLESCKTSLGKRGRDGDASVDSRRLPIIADMMGGVGPFSVPLGKSRACEVHCNDLNPASYSCMVKNARSNNCVEPFLSCYNMDGRQFIETLLQTARHIDHVLMNLPQSATDFLDVFIGYNDKRNVTSPHNDILPLIHVYAFSKCVDTPLTAVADVAERCAGVMRCPVADLGTLSIVNTTTASDNFMGEMRISQNQAKCYGHLVRNVSPKKVMVCLSFQLPSSVADAKPRSSCHDGDDHNV